MDNKKLKKLYGIYLTASYAYYKMDISLLTDDEYDSLCQVLLENYDHIIHRYWYVVRKEDFEAGTGYALRYPPELESAIKRWVMIEHKDKLQDAGH